MKNKSGLTSAFLSFMLFSVAGYPAIAQTNTTDDMGTPTETDVTDPGASIDTTTPENVPDAQMEMDTESSDTMSPSSTQAEVMRGTIASIVDDSVTVELDSGETETVEGLSEAEIEALVPGMVVYVSGGELYMDEMAEQPVGGETGAVVETETETTTESTMETPSDVTVESTTETTTTEPTYGTEVDTTETTTTEPTYGTEVDTTETTTTEPTYGTEVNTTETTTTEPTYGTEVNTVETTTTEPTYGTEVDTTDSTYETQEVENAEPVRALW